jgi:class 3 adenylate cyclase/tetratricopeptide (TPR) repeat protein
MLTCANCGEHNPERARFCLNCGAPLAVEQRRGVRKVVTVVVCDVTGSTALGERLDPESLGRVMARYFERTRAVLERHHGLVQKFIGDAVVAVFGVPVVREDDALRAVRAAAAMQDAVADLDVDGGPAIEVRIGVSTGEVMVEEAGGDPLVIGEAVNLATRLQAAAGPGEVLMDRRTWHLSRDALVAAPVEAGGVRGSPPVNRGSGGVRGSPPVNRGSGGVRGSPPVNRGSGGVSGGRGVDEAWRLVDVSPDALGHARHHDNPLIGRQAELQLFDWVLQRAVRTSTCHLLTVLGPAGVGKSRLVAAAVDALDDAATALYGQCPSDAEGSTFWPVAEIVRRAGEIKTADSPEQAEAKLDELLAGEPDGPQVADRLGRLVGLQPAPVPSEDAVWAVRRFLEVLAARQPLVVVIDDLHWAQPTLLDLIEQVVTLAREAPILLVAVARPELLEQRPGWSGGRLNASSLLLEPLAPDEAATLLEHLAGEASLPAEATRRITRTAEGNPLFLEELLAMLIEEGRLRRLGGRWVADDLTTASTPPTIQALLAARLDRLAGEERALLDRASVMGQAFDRSAVLALSPEPARAEVDAQLLALVRKELLRPAQAPLGGRDGFQFRHQLVRDAAYESLPKQTRAELHERYADWLASAFGERTREVEEVLGWHLERAHRLLSELGPVDARGRELAAAAAERLAAAGRRAMGRGDLPAAINLLERAATLLPAGDRTGLHLLTELGEALVLNVETDRAERVLEEALAAAGRAGDRGLAAHATLGKLELRLDSPDRGPDTYRADVQEVLSLLEGIGDEPGQARAWRLLGLDSYLRCQIGRAEDEFQRAVDHAHSAQDERFEAGNLYALVQAAFWGPTPVADGIRRCEEIRERAEGSYRVEMSALHTLAGLHAMQGRIELARELGEAAAAIAGKLGPSRFAALCSQFLGQVELLAGDPAAAEQWLRWGSGILEQMGERGLRSEITANLARALAAQGRDHEAMEVGTLSGELAVRDDLYAQVERRGPMAAVLARRGRLAEAERLAAEAVEMARDSDMLGMQAGALLDLAGVLRSAGRADEARPLFREALELAERKGHLVVAGQARDLLDA